MINTEEFSENINKDKIIIINDNSENQQNNKSESEIKNNDKQCENTNNKQIKVKTKNMNEYRKKYFEKHKDYLCEKITCPNCGGIFSRTNKSNHLKSKRHQLSLSLINNMMSDITKMLPTVNQISKDSNTFIVLSNEFSKDMNSTKQIMYEVKIMNPQSQQTH